MEPRDKLRQLYKNRGKLILFETIDAHYKAHHYYRDEEEIYLCAKTCYATPDDKESVSLFEDPIPPPHNCYFIANYSGALRHIVKCAPMTLPYVAFARFKRHLKVDVKVLPMSRLVELTKVRSS